MLEELKERVLNQNLLLPQYGLVKLTWGNVSERDPETGYIAIKPSGVEYEDMTIDDIVILDLDGNVIEGKLNPSSDTKTHLEIYKEFKEINGIVHTHSTYATSWAQSGKDIPCYGTTHADYMYGAIPNLRNLTQEEIKSDYEANTGKLIVEYFKNHDLSSMPAVLCKNHGIFSWGKDGYKAVENALVLEEVAKLAFITEQLNEGVEEAPKEIQDKHYFRKHGKDAYYGQK